MNTVQQYLNGNFAILYNTDFFDDVFDADLKPQISDLQINKKSDGNAMINMNDNIVLFHFTFDLNDDTIWDVANGGISLFKMKNTMVRTNVWSLYFPSCDTMLIIDKDLFGFDVPEQKGGDVLIRRKPLETGEDILIVDKGRITWFVTPNLADPNQWQVIKGTKVITLT